jgi:putative tryptophan/tyrosine transport system substrate-binding protein
MRIDLLRRRDFISLLGSAAAGWPLAARAQQPNQIARIGYLGQESAAFDRSHGDSAASRDGLGDLGYVEGRNLHIEFLRSIPGNYRAPRSGSNIVEASSALPASIASNPASSTTSTAMSRRIGISSTTEVIGRPVAASFTPP